MFFLQVNSQNEALDFLGIFIIIFAMKQKHLVHAGSIPRILFLIQYISYIWYSPFT